MKRHSLYQQALNIDSDFASAHLGMALVYQSTNQREELLSSLKKACTLGNDNACNTLKQMGEQ